MKPAFVAAAVGAVSFAVGVIVSEEVMKPVQAQTRQSQTLNLWQPAGVAQVSANVLQAFFLNPQSGTLTVCTYDRPDRQQPQGVFGCVPPIRMP
jgi:hypothetical protein